MEDPRSIIDIANEIAELFKRNKKPMKTVRSIPKYRKPKKAPNKKPPGRKIPGVHN